MNKTEDVPALNEYGIRHRESLKANRPDLYRNLLATGQLMHQLLDVQAQADAAWEEIVGPAIDSKEPDYLKRLHAIETARAKAEERIAEIVLVPDRETSEAMVQGGYQD